MVPIDPARFEALESDRARFGTFVEVGRALLEIQQLRLYRAAGYGTFRRHVEIRWDLSRLHAYRRSRPRRRRYPVPNWGHALPANEAGDVSWHRGWTTRRPSAVWIETVQEGEGRITARSVREHVTTRHPRRPGSPACRADSWSAR